MFFNLIEWSLDWCVYAEKRSRLILWFKTIVVAVHSSAHRCNVVEIMKHNHNVNESSSKLIPERLNLSHVKETRIFIGHWYHHVSQLVFIPHQKTHVDDVDVNVFGLCWRFFYVTALCLTTTTATATTTTTMTKTETANGNNKNKSSSQTNNTRRM